MAPRRRFLTCLKSSRLTCWASDADLECMWWPGQRACSWASGLDSCAVRSPRTVAQHSDRACSVPAEEARRMGHEDAALHARPAGNRRAKWTRLGGLDGPKPALKPLPEPNLAQKEPVLLNSKGFSAINICGILSYPNSASRSIGEAVSPSALLDLSNS